MRDAAGDVPSHAVTHTHTHGPPASCFRCSCVSVSPPVFFRWVVSSAKKEDADEDIAKYDGKSTPLMSFRATEPES